MADMDAVNAVNASLGELRDESDAFYRLSNAFLVFYIQAGFLLLEAGMVRHKNVLNIVFKNVIDTAIGVLFFFCLGFGFAFGSGSPVIGLEYFGLSGYDNYTFFLFQWSFSATAATIVSGCLAERCQAFAYLCNSILMNLWTYPLAVHWVWNREGWLYLIGVRDFAGGSVVHILGGVAGIVGTIMLGPRIGKFVPRQTLRENAEANTVYSVKNPNHSSEGSSWEDSGLAERSSEVLEGNSSGEELSSARVSTSTSPGESYDRDHKTPRRRTVCRLRKLPRWITHHPTLKNIDMPPSNLTLSALGTFIIWYGFYAFNSGSTFRISGPAGIALGGHVAVYTTISAASACMVALLLRRFFSGRYELAFSLNGVLAGLVGSTSVSAYAKLWTAFPVGMVSGAILLGGVALMDRLAIDDPLDASVLHGFVGFWSMISVGLFASQEHLKVATGMDDDPEHYGLLEGGGLILLIIQTAGALVIGLWSATVTMILFYVLKRRGLFRVGMDEELIGLDMTNLE